MLLLFEDMGWRNIAPLVYTRPVFDIRCGAFTLHERVRAFFQSRPDLRDQAYLEPHLPLSSLSLYRPHLKHTALVTPTPAQEAAGLVGLARPHLMPAYGPATGLSAILHESMPITLINGRALSLSWLPDLLNEPINTVYETSTGDLLGARLTPSLASLVLYYLREQEAAAALHELHRYARIKLVDGLLYTYPWDLIVQAGEQLVRDEPLLAARLPRYTGDDPHVVVRGNPARVYVAPSAMLEGPIVLDARDGPVFLDEECHIEPFTVIQGPAYIGRQTLVASARIRAETSIGPVCRVGGEVEACIFQGFSNKHHDGFLGHSWVGEWVNIGAMTTNSDLKNTYGNIQVVIEQLGSFNSGSLKLGCFLADHVKLGIGLHLTGGSIIGTGSSLFSVHMVPKTVPPFTWGSDVFYEYRIEQMIDVAHKVMKRRKQVMPPAYEQMLREVFAMTRQNRSEMRQTSTPPSPAMHEASTRALAAFGVQTNESPVSLSA